VSFIPEDIERMTPAIRAEIQEHLLRQHFARQRRAQFGKDTAQKGWPKSQPWFRHDAGYVYCRDAEKSPG
jgi:hypothetical protein